jgi:hypothetical protein
MLLLEQFAAPHYAALVKFQPVVLQVPRLFGFLLLFQVCIVLPQQLLAPEDFVVLFQQM